jgi:aldehyde:ferredoxin oxidoreductase
VPFVSGTVNEKGVDPEILDENLTTYYAMMGWDPETGEPTEGKLHELDIAWVRDVM